MAIPVNIEDLLHKCKIESTRIEFKTGCNPNKIYRTICVFANDFDNIGRGYITVGVQEEKNTGIAQRPVTDVPIEEFDKIQRDMIGFNHKIEPLNDAINNNARLVLLGKIINILDTWRFLNKTRKGLLYGEWNDNGRL